MPGRGIRWMSATSAVGVDRDRSRRRARCILAGARNQVMRLTCVWTGLPPHITTRSRLRQLTRVGAAQHRGAPAMPARIGERVAICRMLARIAHDVTQPLDPVELNEAHRAGIEERPHRRGPSRSAARMKRSATSSSGIVPRDHVEKTRPRPRGRPAAADGRGGPDDAAARHSARPWRTRRPRYIPARRHGPGRSSEHGSVRPRARTRWAGVTSKRQGNDVAQHLLGQPGLPMSC